MRATLVDFHLWIPMDPPPVQDRILSLPFLMFLHLLHYSLRPPYVSIKEEEDKKKSSM